MRPISVYVTTIHPVVQAPSLQVSCPTSNPSTNLVTLASRVYSRCSNLSTSTPRPFFPLPLSLSWMVVVASYNPLRAQRLEHLFRSINWMMSLPCWIMVFCHVLTPALPCFRPHFLLLILPAHQAPLGLLY